MFQEKAWEKWMDSVGDQTGKKEQKRLEVNKARMGQRSRNNSRGKKTEGKNQKGAERGQKSSKDSRKIKKSRNKNIEQ